MSKPNLFVVIPARSGSKGIPDKNLTYFNNKTLIQNCIEKAINITQKSNIILSTNDSEISQIGKAFGIVVKYRSANLSKDSITLDPVVFDALSTNESYDPQDIVITMQVTSPNVQVGSVLAAVDKLVKEDLDTVISAKEQTHLSWSSSGQNFIPNYKERLNRQELRPTYLETGAFLISRIRCVTKATRIGKKVGIYSLSEEEADDIDNQMDYRIAIQKNTNNRLAIITAGNSKIGTGHIFNCIEIARRLPDFEIEFFILPNENLAKEILRSRNYIVREERNLRGLICKFNPKTLIIDTLDTKISDILFYKSNVAQVISIEDLGSGSHYTDLTVNALYPSVSSGGNIVSGPEYFIPRNEFKLPSTENNKPSRDILIFFGGTDPSNHTEALVTLISENSFLNDFKVTVLLGIGKTVSREVQAMMDGLSNLEVLSFTPSIRDLILDHKMAITSAGRTMFELALLRVPFVVFFQSERDELHFKEIKDRTSIPAFRVPNKENIKFITEIVIDENYLNQMVNDLDNLSIGSSVEWVIAQIRGHV